MKDMETSFSSSTFSSLSSSSSSPSSALKTDNPIVYTPFLDRRTRSGMHVVSSRFFSGKQFVGDRSTYLLKACFLCKKTISENEQIFMYRGDAPFCSEDCRQEQIDMDESLEKCFRISTSASTAVNSSSPHLMKRKPSIVIRADDRLRDDAATVAG